MAKNRSASEAFSIAGTKSAKVRAMKEASAPAGPAPAAQAEASHAQAGPAVEETVSERTMKGSTSTKKRQAVGADRRAVTVYLPRDLYNRLRMATIEQDCSMTNLMIEALEDHLR